MQAKILLTVFAIVIAVGFVAANSIISQASAQMCVGKNGEVFNGGCPPGLNGAAPAKSSAPGQVSGPGNAASQDAPGHHRT
jgi:hypothetical protein